MTSCLAVPSESSAFCSRPAARETPSGRRQGDHRTRAVFPDLVRGDPDRPVRHGGPRGAAADSHGLRDTAGPGRGLVRHGVPDALSGARSTAVTRPRTARHRPSAGHRGRQGGRHHHARHHRAAASGNSAPQPPPPAPDPYRLEPGHRTGRGSGPDRKLRGVGEERGPGEDRGTRKDGGRREGGGRREARSLLAIGLRAFG